MSKEKMSQVLIAMQSPERFKILDDGWIQDSFLGLDFGPSSEKTMNFKDALKYCKEKDGRLPELHELHSLVDFTKREPSINTEFFKDTKINYWYWSGTKHCYYKDIAWCVSFYNGDVFDYNGFFSSYVRPVRASQ